MRVRTYKEAVRLARCAGEDAANRRMRNSGRKAWSPADHDHAARVTEKILVDLGFDITGWVAMGGMPRNEPPEPAPAKRSRNRRRTMAAPMQLSFGF